MGTNKNSSAYGCEEGKYIIIKIPRDTIQHMDDDFPYSFLGEKNLRKSAWILLCLISLFIGVVIGSLFHPDISHQAPDKAVWKSSNLMVPDRN